MGNAVAVAPVLLARAFAQFGKSRGANPNPPTETVGQPNRTPISAVLSLR